MVAQLVIDVESPAPVYEQIRAQIAAAVRTGTLREDDRLPTVRALAADLGVAVNTVARAYQELQSSGLVKVTRRRGTVVVPGGSTPHVEVMRESVLALVREADALGVSGDIVVALVQEAFQAKE